MDNDCPVCQGRKTILTRDYADCEREEPCPHCSEREHCTSCLTLRAENARLREGLTKAKAWSENMRLEEEDGLEAVELIRGKIESILLELKASGFSTVDGVDPSETDLADYAREALAIIDHAKTQDARLRAALGRVRQGYLNILDVRRFEFGDEFRYGALTRREVEDEIKLLDAALKEPGV